MPSRELWTYAPQNEGYTSKVRLAELAARQFGCVSWAQLRTVGVGEATIGRWCAVGYLVPILPRVYSVGPVRRDDGTRLFSLVLFAGPSAELSHGTAAYRRGWLRYPVAITHLSTPRRARAKLRGVRLHCRRELERELVDGVPCTTVSQTLLDVAATESPKLVHRCLAQLDYERKLAPGAIRDACRRGRPGSAALLASLSSYMPQLAHTKSDLEDEYLYLCQRFGIPLPEVNTRIHGEEADCLWRELGLVVELDGGRNHSSAAQRHRDQRKALELRAHGLTVVRYSEDQVFRNPEHVGPDTLAQLEQLDQRRRYGS